MNKRKLTCMLLLGLSLFLVSCGKEKTKEVVIEPVGNEMKYSLTEITAKAGSTLKIILKNTATLPIMVHNVVVLAPNTDIQAFGQAAITAPNNMPNSPDIIAHTAQAKPGEQVEVTFKVPAPGNYPYICTYPGHYIMMQGILRSIP